MFLCFWWFNISKNYGMYGLKSSRIILGFFTICFLSTDLLSPLIILLFSIMFYSSGSCFSIKWSTFFEIWYYLKELNYYYPFYLLSSIFTSIFSFFFALRVTSLFSFILKLIIEMIKTETKEFLNNGSKVIHKLTKIKNHWFTSYLIHSQFNLSLHVELYL